MNENAFNADLAAGLRSQGIFAHKLPDLARGVTKPFDIVANCHGRFWAIEGKLKKVKLKPGETDFPNDLFAISNYKKTFRPHQLPNLQMIEDQGGHGFVAVYLAEEKPGSHLKMAWLVPIVHFQMSSEWSVNSLDTMYPFLAYGLTWGPKRGWLASEWLIQNFGLPR